MKSAKEFYRNYQADDNWSELSDALLTEICKCDPVHVFEFGSGSGKHLTVMSNPDGNYSGEPISCCGLDISITNLLNSHFKNGNKFLVLGDESNLRHLCNFDVVITCSVLDHIEDIGAIVNELKRIANKAVIIAESTKHEPSTYYWNHDYEALDFIKTGFEWNSPADGSKYFIYKWEKK